MKTLLLDVDGVIADCSGAVHKWAEQHYDRCFLPPEFWTQFDFHKCLNVEPEGFYNAIRESDLPHTVELYPGAATAVRALKEHYEVVFVTAHWQGMRDWVLARDALLKPFDCEIIYTHSKHRVHGDILLDDKAATIEKGGKWRGVLFNRPWNMTSPHKDRISHMWELLGSV